MAVNEIRGVKFAWQQSLALSPGSAWCANHHTIWSFIKYYLSLRSNGTYKEWYPVLLTLWEVHTKYSTGRWKVLLKVACTDLWDWSADSVPSDRKSYFFPLNPDFSGPTGIQRENNLGQIKKRMYSLLPAHVSWLLCEWETGWRWRNEGDWEQNCDNIKHVFPSLPSCSPLEETETPTLSY